MLTVHASVFEAVDRIVLQLEVAHIAFLVAPLRGVRMSRVVEFI
jgi:hypothetical protein